MPQDIDRIETAIKYARIIVSQQEVGALVIHGNMEGTSIEDISGDGSCNDSCENLGRNICITIELDSTQGPHEIEHRYETYARINFPGVPLRGTEPGTVLSGGGIRVTRSAAPIVQSSTNANTNEDRRQVRVFLENLKITDPARQGTLNKTDAHGLLVDSGACCHAVNCIFDKCGGSGVCVRGVGSSAMLVSVSATGNTHAGIYATDGGTIEMLAKCRSSHNFGCGVEARRGARIIIKGDDGHETITRRIDRHSKFATRTRVMRNTLTSFQNESWNVREEAGGQVLFTAV